MAPANDQTVSVARQTSLGLYVTSTEAYARLNAGRGAMLLDVRTPQEYQFVGHAEMAVNIPLATTGDEVDPDKGELPWKVNSAFVAQVSEWADPADQLLVTCRSGGRSAMAVNALAAAGFTNVFNIIDGFEGDLVKDPASPDVGRRRVNGWTNAGLPWTYDIDPARMRYRQP